jgi:hypothetical protein
MVANGPLSRRLQNPDRPLLPISVKGSRFHAETTAKLLSDSANQRPNLTALPQRNRRDGKDPSTR